MTGTSTSADITENTDTAISQLKNGDHGFIDAGASFGGSLQYCQKRFKLGSGIGFDIDPAKVSKARANGCKVYQCDLATQKFPANCVNFASMMDFLEHMPSMEIAESVMLNLSKPAKDFLFIRHPSFEDSDYLESLGLRMTWTDWKGHSNMASLEQFREFFKRQNWTYCIVPGRQIVDSSCDFIVPTSAPKNTVRYSPDEHGDKPYVIFDRFIFSLFDIFVKLNNDLTDSEWYKYVRIGSNHCIDMERYHIPRKQN